MFAFIFLNLSKSILLAFLFKAPRIFFDIAFVFIYTFAELANGFALFGLLGGLFISESLPVFLGLYFVFKLFAFEDLIGYAFLNYDSLIS